ncbi:jg3134 [Pararge aegeria aegeria]|uniref:Jg3134 protein n=2 Tax=Pararge aegeria TaxID=116150 RepID=A0A8S4RGV4_9NEOP|nr:jg3134 [Pararge aegeria aegeria]
MENVCSFCGHTTKSTIIKPSDTYNKMKEEKPCIETPMILEKQNKKETKQSNVRIHKLNVYCETKEAFSLSKQNNTLPRLIKETPKIIKNSKKKKDKFAGLCRTAVTAALKLKQDKDKQNKLNLFLKPSTSTV